MIKKTFGEEIGGDRYYKKGMFFSSLVKKMQFLPVHTTLHLVTSLVFLHFNYCNIVINDLTGDIGDKLQRTQNYCLRLVDDLDWIKIYQVLLKCQHF